MSNRDICICGQPYNDHNVFKCMNGSIRNAPNEKKMSNEEFPITRKIGLSIWDSNYTQVGLWVKVSDVEALLQSAQVVYGVEGNWTTTQCENDKFTGLLIAITPLKKKTKAEAALEYIKRMAELGSEEAEEILEMKD